MSAIATSPRPRYRAPRGSSAFTLIELLVVVSIIALLIAILLPSLKSAREQTRTVKCMANLRSISMGVRLYAHDHNGMLPGPLHPPIYRITGYHDPRFMDFSETTWRPWFLVYRVAPYFTKADDKLKYCDAVSTCPTAVTVKKDDDFITGKGTPPLVNPTHSHPYNYLPNSWQNSKPAYYFGWVNAGVTWTGYCNSTKERPKATYDSQAKQWIVVGGTYAPVPLERVGRASAEWMIGDAWRVEQIKMLPPPSGGPPQRIQTLFGTWQMNGGNSWYPLPTRPYHGTDKLGTNLVYFDGHASMFKGIDNWIREFPGNRLAQGD